MVVVDFDGHPQKFDQLQIMSDVVAKDINVFKVDCPREGTRRGWKRTHSEIDTQELGDKWRDEMAAGSKYIIEETWVKANEPHYDGCRKQLSNIFPLSPSAFATAPLAKP